MLFSFTLVGSVWTGEVAMKEPIVKKYEKMVDIRRFLFILIAVIEKASF